MDGIKPRSTYLIFQLSIAIIAFAADTALWSPAALVEVNFGALAGVVILGFDAAVNFRVERADHNVLENDIRPRDSNIIVEIGINIV